MCWRLYLSLRKTASFYGRSHPSQPSSSLTGQARPASGDNQKVPPSDVSIELSGIGSRRRTVGGQGVPDPTGDADQEDTPAAIDETSGVSGNRDCEEEIIDTGGDSGHHRTRAWAGLLLLLVFGPHFPSSPLFQQEGSLNVLRLGFNFSSWKARFRKHARRWFRKHARRWNHFLLNTTTLNSPLLAGAGYMPHAWKSKQAPTRAREPGSYQGARWLPGVVLGAFVLWLG